mmetsp:Transcript_29957/g.57548  ORF Transcript_29957/g.57548 Transcript_29957/m.57548 type:complete len:379 (+) Transcript_29957:399-1535(+)
MERMPCEDIEISTTSNPSLWLQLITQSCFCTCKSLAQQLDQHIQVRLFLQRALGQMIHEFDGILLQHASPLFLNDFLALALLFLELHVLLQLHSLLLLVHGTLLRGKPSHILLELLHFLLATHMPFLFFPLVFCKLLLHASAVLLLFFHFPLSALGFELHLVVISLQHLLARALLLLIAQPSLLSKLLLLLLKVQAVDQVLQLFALAHLFFLLARHLGQHAIRRLCLGRLLGGLLDASLFHLIAICPNARLLLFLLASILKPEVLALYHETINVLFGLLLLVFLALHLHHVLILDLAHNLVHNVLFALKLLLRRALRLELLLHLLKEHGVFPHLLLAPPPLLLEFSSHQVLAVMLHLSVHAGSVLTVALLEHGFLVQL